MIILAILAVLALGGGVSVAAEGAVPGDSLYAVKRSINEEVRSALAIGAEADAQWEIELAGRRLEEASELKLSGNLTVETAAELNTEFNSHAEAALQAVSTMQAEGRGDTAGGLTVALEAVTSAHMDLFTARESGSGMATGKRVFVLPHVLEKLGVMAPRDSSSGQSSGKVMRKAGLSADSAMDASAKDAAKGTMDPDSDADGMPEASAQKMKSEVMMDSAVKIDSGAGVDIQATYDVKAMKK